VLKEERSKSRRLISDGLFWLSTNLKFEV